MASRGLIDPTEPDDDDAGAPPVVPPEGDAPPGDPPPVTPPGETPPGETPPADAEALRTQIREELEAERTKDRPESADAYTLPEIEGWDAEAAADSPVFSTMRQAAFDAGLSNEAFAKLAGDYVEAERVKANERYEAELGLLGKDPEAVKQRTKALGTALTRMLPKDQATALINSATTADSIKAIEALINRAPKGGTSAPPAARDDWATISQLMNSDAYMGREDQRDPKVVARVEAYFNAGGKRGG